VAKKEIKSTLEIAMEKVAKMPKLSPEEVLERREREFGPRGRGIARRYLDGALRLTDLEIEICRFQDEEREVVMRTLKSTLCDAINLEEMDGSRQALEALQVLAKGTGLEDKARELEGIHAEYLRQREQTLAEFEKLQRDRLRQLGISGSAVSPNPEVSRDLQQRLQATHQTFSSRIENFKTGLLQAVDPSPSD
jgi:hypothetical protein